MFILEKENGTHYHYKNWEDLYDPILYITDDTWEAMEVQGWAELATVGEIYEGDNFRIVVGEENE